MSPTEHGLHEQLASGPKQSRDVAEALAGQGITQKQLRRARERLGVVVVRSGRGRDMRSTWSLPAGAAGAPETGDGSSIHARQGRVRNAQIPGHVHTMPTLVAEAPESGLQPFEEDRIARRIPIFISKGLDPSTARQVAMVLTLQRDRPGVRGGSCAECQNLISTRKCTAADAGFADGPRDAATVWVCGYARLVGG